MRIYIKAKPNAKQTRIEKIDTTHYKVQVNVPPRDNKANEAILGVLAEYFNVPQRRIKLISGKGSKQKIFEIF